MKSTLTKSVLVIAALTSFSAFAGESHKGNGDTREAACQAADTRARAAANRKGTCITECEIDSCKKEDDGTWTCVATSANHKGSCPRR